MRPADNGAGYQAGRSSWAPDREDICGLLEGAPHVQMRSILYGSNACYLVVLSHPDAGRSLAVYKPARGEYPLWDFPQGSLYRREVATYRLDRLLEWGVVPPTVVGSGRFGCGSVQLFVEEASNEPVPVTSLRRLILLDWIINNADRKPDHLLVSSGGRLWGIDHGLTFHAQPKLRTVLWHFAGEKFEDGELADLEALSVKLDGPSGQPVFELLTAEEGRALVRRVEALAAGRTFPDPQHKAIPYRW
jgi:hypothetical protein